ncbi:hypothetical protein P171DRAFT_504741 [Karstenula rhodostoma CBS 690.94]|uniref:Uncharacterized protein n=1 Tax=Karstenula rhodostoma CBS 690.94 TaxID=1392251 RepID=A0A9P4U6Z9_9PLEO|nr:hypothetical protein P171DRAFT_504741 [Karstenula rhodostoma CBS 690.94]
MGMCTDPFMRNFCHYISKCYRKELEASRSSGREVGEDEKRVYTSWGVGRKYDLSDEEETNKAKILLKKHDMDQGRRPIENDEKRWITFGWYKAFRRWEQAHPDQDWKKLDAALKAYHWDDTKSTKATDQGSGDGSDGGKDSEDDDEGKVEEKTDQVRDDNSDSEAESGASLKTPTRDRGDEDAESASAEEPESSEDESDATSKPDNTNGYMIEEPESHDPTDSDGTAPEQEESDSGSDSGPESESDSGSDVGESESEPESESDSEPDLELSEGGYKLDNLQTNNDSEPELGSNSGSDLEEPEDECDSELDELPTMLHHIEAPPQGQKYLTYGNYGLSLKDYEEEVY